MDVITRRVLVIISSSILLIGSLGVYLRLKSSPLSSVSTPAPLVTSQSKKPLEIEKGENPNSLFGYIRMVTQEKGKTIIAVDAAEFFSEEQAQKAAHDDGQCSDEAYRIINGCIPNGFYIRNNSASTTLFEVFDQVDIHSLHYSESGYSPAGLATLMENKEIKSIGLAEFKKIYDALNVPGTGPDARTSFVGFIPYNITLKDGKVISFEEKYLP